MAKPIPINILIHTIDYEEYGDQSNGWGDGFAPSLTIENVRVEPVTAVMRSNARNDIEGEAIIFIDRLNSKPFKRPEEKSIVTFDGRKYEIQRVRSLYDENPKTPHHYEVEIK